MIANDDYRVRASSNPRALLSTGTGMPGVISVRNLRYLQDQGRSPIKTAANTNRKRPFDGYRIALSHEFPDFLSHRRGDKTSPSGSPPLDDNASPKQKTLFKPQ